MVSPGVPAHFAPCAQPPDAQALAAAMAAMSAKNVAARVSFGIPFPRWSVLLWL